MTASGRDLIPLSVRFAVRDAVGGWGRYKVNDIAELFLVEGFSRAEDVVPTASGARRLEADAFHQAIDFTSPEQVERYLRIVERLVEDYDRDADDDSTVRRDALLRALRRAGIEPYETTGRLRLSSRPLAASARLAAMPTESDIRLHVRSLERLDQEPEEMVGAAKELVEATAKYILLELDQPAAAAEDLPTLSKRALTLMKLHPAAIAPTTKGAEVMVRMLGAMGQVAGGLAELRNMGYGTGHGQARRVSGLKARHAEFAARAAIAYATFALDTLADPEAPWRTAL